MYYKLNEKILPKFFLNKPRNLHFLFYFLKDLNLRDRHFKKMFSH